MKVSEIMRQPVVVIHKDASLQEAALMMLQNDLRGIPVVDDGGNICGFISVSDYLAKDKCLPFSRFRAAQLFGKWVPTEGIEQIYEEARTISVKQIMSTPVFTVPEDATVEHVIDLMIHHRLSRIPVVRDQKPVGIVARYDLLKMMARKSEEQSATNV